ncbi:MAG: mercury methylation corrinoid protein HgcA [Candidatus Geothermincolia bacterium]
MSATPALKTAHTTVTKRQRLDHFLARWGYRRSEHRVEPGLYAVNAPGPEAPVFVSANYTLSYDSLRSALAGIEGYILVLDTRGINVWCAAGKGTFGTDELVLRIEESRLGEVVRHRSLILPQLGAAGVSGYEVKERSGFDVRFGPVRAADLPVYLATGEATPEMRLVRFDARDRAVLIPIELVGTLAPVLAGVAFLYIVDGAFGASALLAAALAGTALFPLLLPSLPTSDFSSKGCLLGAAAVAPFALGLAWRQRREGPLSLKGALKPLQYLLALPPVTAFIALNFTGATTFASRSDVKREMSLYIPLMAGLFGAGLLALLIRGIIMLREEKV